VSEPDTCGVCGRAVSADAETVGYIRESEGVVLGARVYRLCSRCSRRSKKHPRSVGLALARAYNAETMN
jgi:hypothetical protein